MLTLEMLQHKMSVFSPSMHCGYLMYIGTIHVNSGIYALHLD